MIKDFENTRLRRHQLGLLEVLKDFARICEDNHIIWWLDSGTLLGAARHKGFVPWDDDVDVMVARKDYAKLRRIMRRKIGSSYFYECMSSDPEHFLSYGRFRTKERRYGSSESAPYYDLRYDGLSIDVFSYTWTSGFALHLHKVLYQNTMHPTQYIRGRGARRICIRFVEGLNFLIFTPLCRIIGLLNPDGRYRNQFGSLFYRSSFSKKDVFPLGTLAFEGTDFPVPGNWDAYLTSYYGDWRSIPSEEEIKVSLHGSTYRKELFGDE